MRQLFRELKRRNVYKVAVAYAAAAFVVVQAARLLVPALLLPDWIYRAVVLAAILGFPIALVIAWAFELTPDGVRRTSEEAGEAEETASMSPEERRAQSRLAMKALVGLGLVGAAVAGGWYLMGGGGGPSTEPAATTDTASTEPRAGDRSIAVLPFENMGGEESEQFTQGVHDGLLTRLSNISDLKVISRTSVMQFEQTELPLPAIADSLGVKWVMEGGVQRMGEQIQVNAQLIDPQTDTHAWADRYRRDLTAADLFDLQSEITKRIARSLEAELTPEETRQVERRPTEDLEAYKLYVQGRSRLDTRTEAGMRDAVDYFQRAIEQDSSYALAWSGLADAIELYSRYYRDSVPPGLPDHAEAARRALKLDPELAEARASMGWVHYTQYNAPSALRELQRAVELKPSYAQAHHWLGVSLFVIGRPQAAHEHLSLAVELNPQHAAARINLAGAMLSQGDVEAAERHLQQVDRAGGWRWLKVNILYHTRQWDELEALARKQLTKEGNAAPLWRFSLARIAALRGDTAAARAQLAEIREAEAHVWEGLVHAALGETDEAFSVWRRGTNLRGLAVPLRYLYSDIIDPLRDDPRYRRLLREINQRWGLNPDGSLPDSVNVTLGAQTDG